MKERPFAVQLDFWSSLDIPDTVDQDLQSCRMQNPSYEHDES